MLKLFSFQIGCISFEENFMYQFEYILDTLQINIQIMGGRNERGIVSDSQCIKEVCHLELFILLQFSSEKK